MLRKGSLHHSYRRATAQLFFLLIRKNSSASSRPEIGNIAHDRAHPPRNICRYRHLWKQPRSLDIGNPTFFSTMKHALMINNLTKGEGASQHDCLPLSFSKHETIFHILFQRKLLEQRNNIKPFYLLLENVYYIARNTFEISKFGFYNVTRFFKLAFAITNINKILHHPAYGFPRDFRAVYRSFP